MVMGGLIGGECIAGVLACLRGVHSAGLGGSLRELLVVTHYASVGSDLRGCEGKGPSLRAKFLLASKSYLRISSCLLGKNKNFHVIISCVSGWRKTWLDRHLRRKACS